VPVDASAVNASEQSVKAIALRRLLENAERELGESAVERIIERLPEELREKVRYGAVLGGGWIPIAWLRLMHKAVREEANAGPELPRRFGRSAAKANFTTVHRAFLRVLSPEFVLSRASRIFGQYVQKGEMRIVESRPGMARAVFSGCAGYDHNIWEATIGQCEGVLELCGAKNIRMRIHSGGRDGDDHLDASAYYT
jgi:hypothetical protein